jgi:hypothetical protein
MHWQDSLRNDPVIVQGTGPAQAPRDARGPGHDAGQARVIRQDSLMPMRSVR